MAINIISNKHNKAVTIHVASANASLVVAGNTAASNVAMTDETLTGGYIKQITWGTDAGSIQVLRGANLVATFTQAGSINYASLGTPLTQYPAANLNINFVGSANGYCLVELQKVLTPAGYQTY